MHMVVAVAFLCVENLLLLFFPKYRPYIKCLRKASPKLTYLVVSNSPPPLPPLLNFSRVGPYMPCEVPSLANQNGRNGGVCVGGGGGGVFDRNGGGGGGGGVCVCGGGGSTPLLCYYYHK